MNVINNYRYLPYLKYKKISFGCDLGYPNDLKVEIQTCTCKVLF